MAISPVERPRAESSSTCAWRLESSDLFLKEMGSPPGMMMTVVPTWMALSFPGGALLSTASGRMSAFTAAVSEFDFDLDDRSDGE